MKSGRPKLVLVSVAAWSVTLLFSGSAAAQPFCVPAPCSFGTPEPSLSAALSASNANGGGVTDQIQIAPGTFTETSNPSDDPGNPVEIFGAGIGRTTITRTSGSSTYVLQLFAPGSTVRDLTLAVGPGATTASPNIGLQLAGLAQRVEVTSSGVSNGIGIFTLAVDSPATATVEDSVVAVGDGASSAGVTASAFGTTADLRVRHVTVLGSGAGSGVVARATSHVGTPGSTTVNVRGTIVRGFAQSLSRTGNSSPSSPADLNISYSDYDPASESESGPGSLTEAPGNVNVDPQFASATDFHLQRGSPVIDAGGPLDSTPPPESAVDADGNARVVDGNGDGRAVSDMGAFEYQRQVSCVVPNLKHKKLTKARRRLTAAHCTLGKVKRPKHHKGKLVVKSQSAKPGTVLPDGARVSVKLGPKPPHKKHH